MYLARLQQYYCLTYHSPYTQIYPPVQPYKSHPFIYITPSTIFNPPCLSFIMHLHPYSSKVSNRPYYLLVSNLTVIINTIKQTKYSINPLSLLLYRATFYPPGNYGLRAYYLGLAIWASLMFISGKTLMREKPVFTHYHHSILCYHY